MKPLRSILLLVLLVGSSMVARACSCASHGPVCQSFWTTDSVFVGEVLTIEPITVMSMGGSMPNIQRLVVRFRVNKAYSGNPGSEVAVQTGLGGGDCGYHFDPRHTYLVYGDKSNENLYTGICSGTQPIEQAGAALAWLDSLPSRPKDASVSGKVSQRTTKDYEAAPGITVSVADPSGRERTTSTDASGAYSMTGLVPEDYVVSLSIPKGLTGDSTSRQIQLHEQGCAEVSFWITSDGRISGHVLDSGGQPAQGTHVALAYFDNPNFTARVGYVSYDRSAYTDDHGSYQFDGLLPGKYLVFLNPLGFDDKHPYPRQFYKSGEELETATTIDVPESGAILDIDFTLPPPFTRKPIEVLVTDARGLPVAGAQVLARDQALPNNSGLPGKNTGADGKGMLEVYAERSYYITATINTAGGKQECGGPEKLDPRNASSVTITIVHTIGNCLAYLNPEFKGPK